MKAVESVTFLRQYSASHVIGISVAKEVQKRIDQLVGDYISKYLIDLLARSEDERNVRYIFVLQKIVAV